MKHIFSLILLAAVSVTGLRAADGDLFPYPVPPADLQRLDERCDYLVSHFWDRCDFKSAMSKTEKLSNTFGDWIGFMPYATADTVYAAIDRLMYKVRKSGRQVLHLARLAERWAYCDTASFYSDDVYYPFAKAAASNSKISSADRARFESQVRIIDNTRVGKRMQHLDFVTPDGREMTLDSVRTQVILIFFNDHDCDDCALARVRLSADHNVNALIKAGVLTVLSIEPAEASTEWHVAAASYPDNWIVGAAADADAWFNLRTSPAFYLIDARHKVLAKDFPVEGAMRSIAAIRVNSGL